MIDPSKKFIPHKTLLFFDEITEFPEIATSLKFFHEDGRFDVICSGSMLGVNYKKIESNSVGYKKDYDMFSMDFEEFLWAKGYDDTTVEDMLLHMRELRPFNELEMQVTIRCFWISVFSAVCPLSWPNTSKKTPLKVLWTPKGS